MKNKTLNREKSGLTLVELLVAIAVLSIIIALIVPQLRIASKERNIRETARVVGSAFAAARDQALADGSAGIAIERNPNFFTARPGPDNRKVYFAGTRLFKLRRKPDFTGDDDDATLIAYVAPDDPSTIRCQLTAPLDHIPASNRYVILGGDLLSLSDSSRYRISQILDVRTVTLDTESQLMLLFELDWDNDFNPNNDLNTNFPDARTGESAPPLTSNVTNENNITNPNEIDNFSIKRLRKDRNSVVDLPEGYIIDLRYSGPLDSADFDGDPETHTICSLAEPEDPQDPGSPPTSFFVLFDEQGGLSDFVFAVDRKPTIRLASQSLYLFVNEFDPDNVVNDVQQQAESLLSGGDNLWLTIGLNGGTNIGYNVPPESAAVGNMILQARTLSRQRVSARQ